MEFLGYLLAFVYAFAVLALSMLANRIGLAKRYTRKLVHILVGLEWLILYTFMGTSYHFLVVCLCFTLILYVIYKRSLIPSISSSEDNSPGTVYYGVAMSIMALLLLFDKRFVMPFGIGVIATSLGDGMAGVVGQLLKKYNPKIHKNKTLLGSFANLLFTFCGILLFKIAFSLDLNYLDIFLISFLGVGVELISTKGIDNITVTLSTAMFSHLLLYYQGVQNYILPITLTPFIFLFADKKRALSKGGLAMALMLDFAVSVSLGNFGFSLLLAFFILGILSDKIAKKQKQRLLLNSLEQKGSRRDFMQVLANGGVAAALAVVSLFYNSPVITVMYVASLAEALADTFASSFGIFSRHTFDPFRFRRCPVGQSGGMSLLGTLSSLLGSSLIALLALLYAKIDNTYLLIVIISGFLGSVFDSLLGSLVQAKYRCTVCGKITEKQEHCGNPTELSRGIKVINNDMVNLLSTAFSALLALVFFLLIK